MKKIISNPIFTFILGALICGTTGVIASTLMASNISYTPKDSSWGVNNVEAAIDSLKLSKTSDNYSTEEQVVGTWIDGKPLYQKTFEIASTVAGENTISTQGLDIDHVLSIWGTIYGVNNSNEFDYQINSNLATNAEENISWYRKTAQQVVIQINSTTKNQVGRTAVVTIQYTKTTD